MAFQIEHGLTSRHRLVLQLHMKGVSNNDIADKVDLKHDHVSRLIHSPQFQHELEMERSKIDERTVEEIVAESREALEIVKDNAKRAALKIASLIDNASAAIALRASESMLDRSGVPKITRSSIDGGAAGVVVIDAESARIIAESLKAGEKDECRSEDSAGD